MTSYTKEQARIHIEKLVAQFKQDENVLLDKEEAMIENNFVRPLFRFLNWNVDNTGLSEPQWEFILQRTTREGSRPDYVLQLDGQHLFVMDVKRVKYEMHDPCWLNQVYAYAYSTQNNAPSKKIDFAILTDFQEFIVLDCTLLAGKPEVVNNFRVIDWRYPDYVERFDELWELFERNNVLAASRERKTGIWSRYLSPKKVKANRLPPDKAFLAALDDEKDGWRVRLAKDMKKQDPSLGGDVLTAAVQLLIDRLVFVKVLSDREIEQDYLAQMAEIVERDGLAEDDHGWFAACKNLFAELNTMYNGSIFAPRPELETVAVSNQVVREILRDLQPENSPYNFAVLPVEILGTIYERFLGRVVNATAQRVKIEDKPEVRKAGGVYYTPQYIVNYIVQNTVGKLLADCKTPADVAKLKILDPACGSGSFLLGAYDALIEWHKNYYSRRGDPLRSPAVGQAQGTAPTKRERDAYYLNEDGRVRLTAKLKRQILLNNIYGVDIDPQAVEVTRLSLSLKALEDTRSDEAHQERTLFNQTLLPNLSDNIKCGNSLIGTDYICVDDAELRRVKPFDWETQFPQVFGDATQRPDGFLETRQVSDTRGFDAVIGNPPWISAWTSDDNLRVFISQQDIRLTGHWDIYLAFLLRSLRLLKSSGKHAFVYPTSILTEPYAKETRKSLIEQNRLSAVAVFGTERVFADVSRKVCILVLSQAGDETKTRIDQWETSGIIASFLIPPSVWLANHNYMISVDSSEQKIQLKQKITVQSIRVGNLYYVNYGAQISSKEKGAFTQDKLLSSSRRGNAKKCLRGDNVKRYSIDWSGMFLDYQPQIMYGPRHPKFFESPKIIINKTSSKGFGLIATYDDTGYYADQRSICLVKYSYLANTGLNTEFKGYEHLPRAENEYYHLGLLNSKLLTFWFANFVATKNLQGNYTDVLPKMVRDIPLRTIDFSNAADRAAHDKMVQLVEQMLDLHKRLNNAKTETDRELYQRQIDATDKQIDTLVYQLYDLSAEEIAIVEGNAENETARSDS